MGRKGHSLTLNLDQDEKEMLERIALKYGCTWGEKPNISALLKAIAQGDLIVGWGDEKREKAANTNQLKMAVDKVKSGMDDLLNALS